MLLYYIVFYNIVLYYDTLNRTISHRMMPGSSGPGRRSLWPRRLRARGPSGPRAPAPLVIITATVGYY